MSERIDRMESCLAMAEKNGKEALPAILQRLRDPEWRVQYAAAVALGDLRDTGAVHGLIDVLNQEDAAPLFTQKEEYGSIHAGANDGFKPNLPALDENTRQAWKRRGRLKQAVCLALGEIGATAEPARPWLERYADSETEDHIVRAAACKALGLIGNRASLPVLEKAIDDAEWCTSKEATKAVASFSR